MRRTPRHPIRLIIASLLGASALLLLATLIYLAAERISQSDRRLFAAYDAQQSIALTAQCAGRMLVQEPGTRRYLCVQRETAYEVSASGHGG